MYVWQWSYRHLVFVCWVCGVWVWHKWDSCHVPGDVSRCHHIPVSLSLHPPDYRLSLSPDTFQSYRLSSQITGICLLCTILHIPGPCVTLLDRGRLTVVLTQESPHTTCLPPSFRVSRVWNTRVDENSNFIFFLHYTLNLENWRNGCTVWSILARRNMFRIIGRGKLELDSSD